MVEQVGLRTVAAVERKALRDISVQQVPPAPARRDAQVASQPAPASTARALAASPPVDMERVARIRRAVEEGRFPISPATIADRLIAVQFEWNKLGTPEGQARDGRANDR
jgi:negative regulator of flagellin synthesis FlgM